MEGAELIFVIFPLALSMMQYGNLFSILFYFMMINLGFNTIIAYVEYISTLFEDITYIKKLNLD